MNEDFSFQITESIAVISEAKTGWKLELNKVSWGGRPAKFDIRSWSPDHQKMGKGVTLTDEEIKKLGETIQNLSF